MSARLRLIDHVCSRVFAGFLILAGAATFSAARADSLEEDFENPPMAARPYVWWHWMGCNVTREGITKDLEAMKSAGIGGATIFNLTSSVQAGPVPIRNTPWPENTYRSKSWWSLVEHAASEARRLGLEIGMHNCVGYSASGGPWITPERGMKRVVWSESRIDGGRRISILLEQPPANLDWYRDIAVVAVPSRDSVRPTGAVDVSAHMDKDGRLDWDAPGGLWTLYRFGYTPTGAAPSPQPEDVKALECDKLSADHSKYHMDQVIGPIQDHLGAMVGTSFRHLLFDSYEAGDLNWTEGFREEFHKRRGYDPLPWLPALAGSNIHESAMTARFKWDFQTTISELFVENNFMQANRMIHSAGMQMQLEPYTGPFDTTEATLAADLPMVEFWTGGPGAVDPKVTGPAQAAGRRVVAAEALTGKPQDSRWSETPAALKTTGDGGYCGGVNRLILHHWVHQPFGDDLKPGMVMGWWGTHFGRNQTWFEPGKAWLAYLGRCQALLQRGEAVADFSCLESPANNADLIPRSMLLHQLSVKDGQWVLNSGRKYPFLYLPNREDMLPEVARKLKELVVHGATLVVGPSKPVRSPSLRDYPDCDREVRMIGEELWPSDSGTRLLGKGRVIAGRSPQQVLTDLGTGPDVNFNNPGRHNVRFSHRRDGDADIYFVANLDDAPVQLTASFRISGKTPEIWLPVTGRHTPAGIWREEPGRTAVELSLARTEAVFVVFRKPMGAENHVTAVTLTGSRGTPSPATIGFGPGGRAELLAPGPGIYQTHTSTGMTLKVDVPTLPEPLEIGGPWELRFGPGVGAPEHATFGQLESWSTSADPGVRYFSGSARYLKDIEVPAALLKAGLRLTLDMGMVKDMAEVTVNGKNLGILWHPPFQIDTTEAMKPGVNHLEIVVTNTWANRMIGDEQEPNDVIWGMEATSPWKGPDGQAVAVGRALAEFPEWILKHQARPSAGRRTFATWNYFHKDSKLLEAGLLSPVVLRTSSAIPLVLSAEDR